MSKSLLTPIIFNRGAKRVAQRLLACSLVSRNPLYQAVYRYKVMKDMAKYEKRPLRVRLGNTNICGENCSFCPHKDMKRKQGKMSMGLYKRLVNECAVWGVPEIVIQEFGEPFRDPLFFDRVEYAYKKRIPKIQTNSNCKFITKTIAHRIMDSHLSELFISCNKEGWNNIKYLSTLKKPEHLKIYLSGIQGCFVPKKLKNVTGVSISYTHNWAGKKGCPALAPRDPCKLLWVTMYVTWTGKLALCCMDIEAEHLGGDVNNTPLKELWQSAEYRRRRLEHSVHLFFGLCKDCSYNRHDKFNWWI